MPQIGKIGEFVEGKENFANYTERVELFFEANDIKDGKRAAVFLSLIGPTAYGVLKNIISPDKPKDRRFNELVTALRNHYTPKPLVISERFKFHKRNQHEGESVSAYVVELKKLAQDCEFGTFLNEALRDRLVCGLRCENIQKKLLSTDKLSFDEALKTAVAMETAEKDTVSFSQSEPVKSVAYVKDKRKDHHFVPNKTQKHETKQKQSCFRCGEAHDPFTCRHKDSKCYKCQRKGHLAKKCRTQQQTYLVEDQLCEQVEEELGIFTVYMNETEDEKFNTYEIPLVLGNAKVNMQLDTGSACTIVNESTYKKSLSRYSLHKTSVLLRSYSGDSIEVLGEIKVPVRYEGRYVKALKLLVVGGRRPNLLGRDWLSEIKLNWKQIFVVSNNMPVTLEGIKEEFKDLFQKDNKPIQGFKAKIRVKENASPIFCKARPVPYSVKDQVTEELKRLEKEGIIELVRNSQWAAPLVVVPKPNNKLRLCGDFKVTVNREISEEQYPLPNTQDLFATLAGGQKFTKLDLSQAYTQLELEEQSQEYLTLNTHLGLFRCKRLAYGVSSAPAIFQSVMDTVLAGLSGVVCRIDDILITERNDERHPRTLEEVLSRLRTHNIKLNKDKCEFMVDHVVYMGHIVDAEGIHATAEKTKAIREAPAPTNVSELRSYLGLINYYGPFLPNLSTVLHPLHQLLRKEVRWEWSTKCEEAFQASKELLVSSQLLVHYDMKKEIRLACDASSYGLGAVISHVMEDGTERPIAYASRTLNSAEKNYAQIEKEALGIIFGVEKFHKYLYGRKFTLVTDHQALTTILGPKRGIPNLAAARIQRWALKLSAYDYQIVYRKSQDHGNCDGLSRLPLRVEERVHHVEEISPQLQELAIDSSVIAEATRRDPVLSRVYDLTLHGWPNHVEDETLKPYFSRRVELSVDQGVVLWGLRVIIPPKLQGQMLTELHDEHLGMCRMKALARGYVWWPNLDSEIEAVVKACEICQAMRNTPVEAPLHPWKWATRPMERVHVDFAELLKVPIQQLYRRLAKILQTYRPNHPKQVNVNRKPRC